MQLSLGSVLAIGPGRAPRGILWRRASIWSTGTSLGHFRVNEVDLGLRELQMAKGLTFLQVIVQVRGNERSWDREMWQSFRRMRPLCGQLPRCSVLGKPGRHLQEPCLELYPLAQQAVVFFPLRTRRDGPGQGCEVLRAAGLTGLRDAAFQSILCDIEILFAFLARRVGVRHPVASMAGPRLGLLLERRLSCHCRLDLAEDEACLPASCQFVLHGFATRCLAAELSCWQAGLLNQKDKEGIVLFLLKNVFVCVCWAERGVVTRLSKGNQMALATRH